MNYMPRPGDVRVTLCGRSILVPSRAVFSVCNNILPISLFESLVWGGIEKDYPVEKILEALHIFSKAPDEELIVKIDEICQRFYEKGFIISKPPVETGSDPS